MKKLIALVLVLCVCAALCACDSQEEGVTTYRVGISIYQFSDNFMTLYRNNMEEYFEAAETDTVKYDVTIVDARYDMAEQSNQVNTFIAQGMDVIILNIVQTSSAYTMLKTIQEAGIPVVLVNREPDAEYVTAYPTVCYVGAKAQDSGTYQGEIIAELENKGDLNGDGVVKYVMIEGDADHPDARYRTEYSVAALKEAIPVECLDDQIGSWDQAKANEIMANALAKYGNEIEVVFCNNDAMALGASAAIKDAGRTVGKDIYLVGVDALDEAVEMVKAGTMTGTVLNDDKGQARQAVDCAIAYLRGETLEDYYWVPYIKVDKKYADENY